MLPDHLIATLSQVNHINMVMACTVSVCLSLLLRWHYLRFADAYSSKLQIANIFLPLSLTTLLIIVTVKSSLALSLGLVGALSIIRFRTPIKDPEELVYIFLALAIGIGSGADKAFMTVFVTLVILGAIAAYKKFGSRHQEVSTHLNIEWKNAYEHHFETINGLIKKHASLHHLKKLSLTDSFGEVAYLIKTQNEESFQNLIKSLQQEVPESQVHFFDGQKLSNF